MPNEQQVMQWDGPIGGSWARLQDRYDAMLRPLGDLLLGAADPRPGERALDIGCGCGATTLDLGLAVGAGGAATGVDVSAAMLQRARDRAAEAKLTNVRFVQEDAQTARLSDGHDLAVSRFGVMFFEDPVAAFRNLRAAVRPGGRLVFVCWQEMAANPFVQIPASVFLRHAPQPDTGADPGPGPFSLADGDYTARLLADAGWSDVSLERVTRQVVLGGWGRAEEAAEFSSASMAGRRILANAAPDVVAAALADLARELRPHETEAGVVLDCAAWLVQASNAVG